jgi:hypothetical protein
MSKKFGKTTTMIVFLVEIKFFVNSADSTKANTGLGMYLMMGIALDKERNSRGVFSSRGRPYKKSRSWLLKVQHVNQGHITLFIVLAVYLDQLLGHKYWNWLFYLAHYSMSFCPNHMIYGLLKSQDHVVYWTKVLKQLIMSSSYTEVISQKHANTWAVFWATVYLVCLAEVPYPFFLGPPARWVVLLNI